MGTKEEPNRTGGREVADGQKGKLLGVGEDVGTKESHSVGSGASSVSAVGH